MQPNEFGRQTIKPIECAKEAWELIKPDYWVLFAVLVVGVITAAFTLYILMGAMICGIMYCYLRRIDGFQVRFEDLWKGLSFFWPSLPVMIIIVVPIVVWTFVLISTVYLPIMMAAAMGDNVSGDQLTAGMGGVFAFDVIIAIAMICFHTLVMFSFPLVVDRGLTGFRSISVSAKAVWNNLGGVCGLIGVNFILAIAGELACGIGLYFVLPLIMAMNLVAYRKVFPAMGPANLNSYTPNIYS